MARLAGIPESVLRNARDILRTLELEKEQHRPHASQMEMFATPAAEIEPVLAETKIELPEVVQELAAVNVNNLTPMDAMNLLFTLQKKAQEVVQHGTD